jgi:predicted small secreted protein
MFKRIHALMLAELDHLPTHSIASSVRNKSPRGEQSMVRKIFALAVVAGSLMAAACNTVEGAGKDVSSAGKAVSSAASDAK